MNLRLLTISLFLFCSLENFSQTNSIILAGDRGTGKTALIKDFLGKLNEKNSVVVHVVDFTNLKADYSLNDFYIFLIENFSVSLFYILA